MYLTLFVYKIALFLLFFLMPGRNFLFLFHPVFVIKMIAEFSLQILKNCGHIHYYMVTFFRSGFNCAHLHNKVFICMYIYIIRHFRDITKTYLSRICN